MTNKYIIFIVNLKFFEHINSINLLEKAITLFKFYKKKILQNKQEYEIIPEFFQ
jgi:hypothetical protein